MKRMFSLKLVFIFICIFLNSSLALAEKYLEVNKTKESKMISSRDVVLFKPSKEFKEFVNLKDNG